MNDKQDMLDIYVIKYPGSWMGGNAVVKAYSEQNAWDMLKENNEFVDPIEQCTFTKIPESTIGVIYNWDGEY